MIPHAHSAPRALVILVTLCSLVACFGTAVAQSGATVAVQHAQGETTVPVRPDVVFSFDYAAIDTLAALGIHVDGMPPMYAAGEGRFPNTAGATSIGTLFEPDYEVVNAADPDLIIVAARSSTAYDQLSRIAPTIDLSFSGDDFLGDLRRNTRILGQIFDVQDEAERLLSEIDMQIEALRVEVANGGTGLVVMSTGGNVTALASANAPAGRGAFLYSTLGLEPPVVDVEAATHGEPISFEFLLEHDPDRLFVIDRDAAIGTEGAQPAQAVLDNEIVRQTAAWQNGAITYLDPFDWYLITGAGLNSAQRMLAEIAAAYDVP